jgi:uncharacterized protein (TIGR02300 family)
VLAIDSRVTRRQGKHRFFDARIPVAKPELGTKRLCGNCGAKFYDLSKDPIVCPKCSTVFVPTAAMARAGRAEPVAARAAAAAAAGDDEAMAPDAADAEFVSLEDADKEVEGTKGSAEGAEEVEPDDESLDDAAFIVPEEDEEDDVTDIIGDVDDDEET